MKKLLTLPFALLLLATPAKAQWAVFDPANLGQAVQNGVQMYNQLKTARRQYKRMKANLERLQNLDFRNISQAQYSIDRTLAAADGLAYTMANIDRQFGDTFPDAIPEHETDQKIQQGRKVLNTMRGTLRSLGRMAQDVQTATSNAAQLESRIRGVDTPQKARQLNGAIQASQVKQTIMLRQAVMQLSNQQAAMNAYQVQQRRQLLQRGRATLRAMQNVQNPTTERFDGTWSFTN